jgi:hypothetical protein
MQVDEVALLEGFRLPGDRSGSRAAQSSSVPEAGGGNVAHPVNVNKEAGKVDLLVVLDDHGGAFEHPMTVFKRREAVVDAILRAPSAAS